MWEYFLNIIYIHALEISVAIAGTIYLKKVKPIDYTKYLVLLLYVIVFVELIANYAAIAYLSDYKFLGFVKDTPFRRNYWLYNIFTIFQFYIYISYFRSKLDSKIFRNVVQALLIAFVLISIVTNFTEDWFFRAHSPIIMSVGTLVLFTAIGFFYLEIIRSDKILFFFKLLPFYISVGVLIFFLCVTPLFIYSTYFKAYNTTYVSLNTIIIYASNTFMYGIFIFAFLKCSKYKDPSLPAKSSSSYFNY